MDLDSDEYINIRLLDIVFASRNLGNAQQNYMLALGGVTMRLLHTHLLVSFLVLSQVNL